MAELNKGKSNAMIVLECMLQFPTVSEATVRKDLKEIIQHLHSIELENAPEIKTRMLEVGWKLLEDARAYGQMSAAVNQWKNMANVLGITSESHMQDNQSAAPENNIVRERINKLMKNKRVMDEANRLGLDLDSLKEP